MKKDYLQYLRAIEPKLAARAVIVADNVVQHARDMQDFLDAVRDERRFQSVTVRALDEKRRRHGGDLQKAED